jgi:hypothetical protein
MPEPKNWKRLALEGMVIVASILLAFGIQAGWEEWQELDERDALVALLRDDVAKTITKFKEQGERASIHLLALDELWAIAHGVEDQPAPDSLAILFRSLNQLSVFVPSVAAFQAAAGGPAWALIPTEVKVELASFANSDEMETENNVSEQVFLRLHDLYARYGGLDAVMGIGPDGSRFAPDHEGLLADPEFLTWLSRFAGLRYAVQGMRDHWIPRLAAVDSTLAELVGETPR